MTKKVIVLLADGCEEVETVTPIIYLRRAGIEVTAASIGENLTVKGARGVQITADIALANLDSSASYDAIIVPGGLKGAENLAACEKTGALLKKMAASGKTICAICASPALVLAPLGLLAGKKFTCYPDFEKKVIEGSNNSGCDTACCEWSEDRVVIDGNLITSRAAGTSGEFAIAIISNLLGEEAAKKIAGSVLL